MEATDLMINNDLSAGVFVSTKKSICLSFIDKISAALIIS